MVEAARILRFPDRWRPHPLSPREAGEDARSYLESAERSAEETDRALSEPDVVSALCKLLRDAWNSTPKLVAEEASAIHAWLREHEGRCGLFDERDYFLGETALLTAGALRLLGDRDQAERWLERADSGYRHTVNPGPLLAQVAYLRLALQYDRRRYQDVLELLPSTMKSFEKFGMRNDVFKTQFLEAMTLKECSRSREAFDRFVALKSVLDEQRDGGLLGQVLVEIGAYHTSEGRHADAINCYQQALSSLVRAERPSAVAHLRMTVGDAFRAQGALSSAVEAFRDGVRAYAELRMETSVAYARIILAETLIALGRHREAEWEILAALPTIEEQKMVPEGFAAVALLRESVRRRNTDPNALRELREHLQSKA